MHKWDLSQCSKEAAVVEHFQVRPPELTLIKGTGTILAL